MLELSLREALAHQHSYIGTEHILLGTLREGEGVAARILVGLGVNLEGLRQQVEQVMGVGGDPEPSGTGRPSDFPYSSAQTEEDRRLLEEIEATLAEAGHHKILSRYLASDPGEGAGPDRDVTEALARSILELQAVVRQLATRILKRPG